MVQKNGYNIKLISQFVRNKGRNIIDKFIYNSRDKRYYYIQTEGGYIRKTIDLGINKEFAFEKFKQIVK